MRRWRRSPSALPCSPLSHWKSWKHPARCWKDFAGLSFPSPAGLPAFCLPFPDLPISELFPLSDLPISELSPLPGLPSPGSPPPPPYPPGTARSPSFQPPNAAGPPRLFLPAAAPMFPWIPKRLWNPCTKHFLQFLRCCLPGGC